MDLKLRGDDVENYFNVFILRLRNLSNPKFNYALWFMFHVYMMKSFPR